MKPITEDTIERTLLGLPLKEAISLLEKNNLRYEVCKYSSLRGVEAANDLRVLRVNIVDGCAQIVVSEFLTEL